VSGYYLRLALHNLRRNPWLTALIVTAVALGIGSSMTVFSILRAMEGDPIPQKSDRLFTLQFDNFGPENRNFGKLPTLLTYKDVVAIKKAAKGMRQAAMYEVDLAATTESANAVPVSASGRATHADFFAMFEVPFRSGSPWSTEDDESRANVVVLTANLADKLFPGVDAVGRTVRLEDREYRVTGVTRDWAPSPRFYDVGLNGSSAYDSDAELFIPFETGVERGIQTSGAITCRSFGGGRTEFLAGECVWTQFWVELPDEAAIRRYRDFLNGYAAEQQRAGRFSWLPETQLHDVRAWLRYQKVAPDQLRIASYVAFGFLLVCIVNAVALMLARSSRRSVEFSLRRALGASRRALFVQGLWESLAVGVVGGIFGLVLMIGGLRLMRSMLPEAITRTTSVEPYMMVLAVALSVGATICAGMYPAWRSSRTAGALQLKSQ
jgi:putative ABC transport system permease protein